jgi:hypothetical protein
MAEAVIGCATIRVREHLVCLRNLTESAVRVRGGGDIGMQLARECPECSLYLRTARATGDAEHLVVVALSRGHQRSRLFVDILDEP